LLANADPGLDRLFAYRDAIDLGFLCIGAGGTIPEAAVTKATQAYGADISTKAQQAVARLAQRAELQRAADTL
jgi:hypothetical protein